MIRPPQMSARPLIVAALLVLAGGAAGLAQDGAETLAHEALLESLRRNEDVPRFAFNRNILENGEQMELHYDPAAAEGQEWTLIYPASPDMLSDGMREALAQAPTQEAPDRRILFGYQVQDAAEAGAQDPDEPVVYGAIWIGSPDDAGGSGGISFGIGGALRLIAEDETHATYSFVPAERGESGPGLSENFSGELTVAKDGPIVSRLRYFTKDSFKPNAVSRIDSMDLTMNYAEMGPGGPVVLVSAEGVIHGRALFQKVSLRNGVVHAKIELPAPAD